MAIGRKTGGGSRKGIQNKATADARRAIADFVDGNAHRLQAWLDQVAQGVRSEEGKWLVSPDPERAFQMLQSVIEYHVPKLARQDITTGGKPLPRQVEITVLPVAPRT